MSKSGYRAIILLAFSLFVLNRYWNGKHPKPIVIPPPPAQSSVGGGPSQAGLGDRVSVNRSKCAEGKLDRCAILAELGQRLKREGNLVEAKAAMEMACRNDIDNADVCERAGALLDAPSIPALKTLCDKGDAAICAKLAGFSKEKGDNPGRESYLFSSCKAGFWSACYAIGTIKGKGAEEEFGNRCRNGDNWACAIAAAGIFSSNGDLNQAIEYAKITCKRADVGSCMAWGLKISEGDYAKEKQSCLGGSFTDCIVAAARDYSKDPTEGKDFLSRACNSGMARSCDLLKRYFPD